MKSIFRKLAVGNWQLAVIGVFVWFLLLTAHCSLLTPVEAATSIGIKQPGDNSGVQVGNNSADTLLGGIIRNAIVLVFTIASVSTVVMFLWGSVDWILSGGDKEKIAAARKKIMASLVGLILLAMSFLIISLIGVFIGFNPFKNLQIPSLGAGISPGNNIKNAGGGNVQ